MVQLCCCAFYKAFLTDPIGSSQELTLRATIAMLGSVSSRQLLFHDVPCAFNFLEERERERVRGMYDFRKMLQRIRNVLEVTWRRCYNVSGTSCKLLEEDVTTYQERLASCLKKMLQRIRNVLQVTWRRCYNVSGTSCKLLEEDVTTYQERLASYLKKMLQRIRNVWLVTWRRCYNVSGTSWKLLEEDVTTCQELVASYSTPPKEILQKWQQSRPSMGAVTINIPLKKLFFYSPRMKSGASPEPDPSCNWILWYNNGP